MSESGVGRRILWVVKAAAYCFCALGLLALAGNGSRYYLLHQAYRKAQATIVSAQPATIQKNGQSVYVGDLGVVYQMDGRKQSATTRVIAPAADVSPAAFSIGRVINILVPLDPGKVKWAGDNDWPIAPEFDGRTGMRVGGVLLIVGLLLALVAHRFALPSARPPASTEA